MNVYVLIEPKVLHGMYYDMADARCLGVYSSLEEAQTASKSKKWDPSRERENSWISRDIIARIDMVVFTPSEVKTDQ